ncbi:ABC-type transport system involved in resistance to organic solvents, periplasmic component [Caenispirillum salinarum AK4]|uniref:ABC-type transport system involved in resistance to organic solvents, periplasmic component n=1 Tax=Caenispirillum salinarum AK4 TaxID=1238182 RepID=K9H1F8_9PROT|nr:outer membrane lipid asymmetry maintenance protein MlaD [Caenispirillum salinarum]EKV32075.1 ABC-type transport system involved in resistance to organic solvents, periplasmic component [Caenispirillum salinarum AK4]
MGRNPIETILGAVVLVVAGLFLAFAYSMADVQTVDGYPLTAVFNKTGDLTVGADVRVSGIKVGTVTEQRLDTDTFRALVGMTITPDVQLPADSTASIVSDGLLGGQYVKLQPGSATEKLQSGATIDNTEDFQALEDMVGDIIFLATQGGTQ